MATMASSDTVRNIRQSLHDLAQPLATITGMIDLLLLEINDHDPLLRELQTISEQLEKVLQIVGEIRRFARETSPGEPILIYAPHDRAP